MVTMSQHNKRKKKRSLEQQRQLLFAIIVFFFLIAAVVFIISNGGGDKPSLVGGGGGLDNNNNKKQNSPAAALLNNYKNRIRGGGEKLMTQQQQQQKQVVFLEQDPLEQKQKQKIQQQQQSSTTTTSCAYKSISHFAPLERHPHKSSNRHIVDPPSSGSSIDGSSSSSLLTLVCCETTAGPMSIAVHNNWAPLGAQRFLDMVKSHYFSSRVPMMRCIEGFLCQFGIAGDPRIDRQYASKLMKDDPQWLPPGPPGRFDEKTGVKRFAKGYMSYAGSGPNSRSNQFFVSLRDQGGLGGGSPWEVPWGELVGTDSYETLEKLYKGYGDDGPPQPLLHREGASDNVKEKYPLLDYMTSCTIMDQVEDS